MDVQAVRCCRLTACRAVEDAFPGEPFDPSADKRRHATPHARMIVRARRTSPPSRCTSRVSASIRVIVRVTTISAPSLRACLRHGSPARRRRRLPGSRDSSRSATTFPPDRRSLTFDDDRSKALRRAVHRRRQPGGPCADDHRVVFRRLASVPSPKSSATRRSCGRTTVLPSTMRMTGQSRRSGVARPTPQRASAESAATR